MAELKPCPFCGSNNVEFIKDWRSIDDYAPSVTKYYVLCNKCKARGPQKDEFTYDEWDNYTTKMEAFKNDEFLIAKLKQKFEKYKESQKQQAIDAWNKRSLL